MLVVMAGISNKGLLNRKSHRDLRYLPPAKIVTVSLYHCCYVLIKDWLGAGCSCRVRPGVDEPMSAIEHRTIVSACAWGCRTVALTRYHAVRFEDVTLQRPTIAS
jgi:hypothetical protein